MKFVVGVTDGEWFRFLHERRPDEANFWRPSGKGLSCLDPGEPFLFKLHSPNNFIVGGGLFVHFSRLPYKLAWETFGEANGADSLSEMRRLIEKYRGSANRNEDYPIGCILLSTPFFFDRTDWIPIHDFPRPSPSKVYDTEVGQGAVIWKEVLARLSSRELPLASEATGGMWGEPTLTRPRLGQGSFRVIITDTYQRRCAVTGERVLPVLEAAHIKPVSDGGQHEIANGMLLRSDIHRLFDRGYVTVTPDHSFRVSRRIKQDFDNGEEYYQLEGSPLWLPRRPEERPRREFLEWHSDNLFMG